LTDQSRFELFIVALEFQPELVVIDQQISIAAARDRVRHDLLHFLRHDADIGLGAAIVAETIEAKAIAEMAEKHDVVLERDIGSTSASTATAAAEPTAAASS
jgi:hypothetical protein